MSTSLHSVLLALELVEVDRSPTRNSKPHSSTQTPKNPLLLQKLPTKTREQNHLSLKMSASNYSIYAIPAFYILALVPQFYSTILIYRATNGRFDNVNPRGAAFSDTCKKSLDKATLGRFERARAAHVNALENLPLFAAAVICGNIAGLESGMINSVRVLLYPVCSSKSLQLFEMHHSGTLQ